MTRRPFDDIAGVWTHLALAEVIAVERPARYWETHAGPAAYPIERGATPAALDRGAWHFHDHAARSPALAASQYGGLLRELMAVDQPLYPGPPLVAMRLLGHAANGTPAAHFLFCDPDPTALTDITHHARLLDIPPARVDTREADGADAVAEAARDVPPADRAAVLAHVDPHQPPTAGLFAALAADGFMALRGWSHDVDLAATARLTDAVAAARAAGGRGWGGEITIIEPDGDVRACGVLTANLSAESVDRCRTLGLALAKIYPSASFRDL